MLATRVLTAVAVLPVVLGMLFFAPSAAWAAFALAIALVACWEWSRLCGLAGAGSSLFLLASGAIGGALIILYLRLAPEAFARAADAAFVAAAYFWIFAAPFWMALKLRPAPWAAALAGWVVVWPAWAAFVWLHDLDPWLLLAVALLVWIADIAAYFAGKRFGRVKLAPAISPGKTREGVLGALAGVLAYALALAAFASALPRPLSAFFEGPVALAAIVVMLALGPVSVVGDLFESWMKRGAGLKDSSRLLPGHGGVLDRIDALTSTLPVAALVISLQRQSAGAA